MLHHINSNYILYTDEVQFFEKISGGVPTLLLTGMIFLTPGVTDGNSTAIDVV
jgi:hypothetical protein